jgi:hypothetical protein
VRRAATRNEKVHELVDADGLDADMLIAYADLAEAVITGDETHPRVRRHPDAPSTH